jgi:hypothetical protein
MGIVVMPETSGEIAVLNTCIFEKKNVLLVFIYQEPEFKIS